MRLAPCWSFVFGVGGRRAKAASGVSGRVCVVLAVARSRRGEESFL